MPHGVEICSDREQACALCLGEHARSFRLATGELGLCGFERAQALFPFALEPASNQAIIRIDRAIATLGPARRVARSLDAKPPLLEGRLAIGLEALGSSDRGGKPDWLECRNEGTRDGLVDLDTADVETVAAAPVDEVLAAAMVAGSRVSTAIVCAQTTAAVTAAGDTLQECAAFSHGATRLGWIIVRPRSRVLGDACLVGFIARPFDVSLMVLRDEYLPLVARQTSHALLTRA